MTTRAVLAIVLAAAAGCGDGPTCPSDIVVVIESPRGNLIDDASSADGVQTDVDIRSNLLAGDELSLVVSMGDADIATYATTADQDGRARFAQITVPTGLITLRVSASSACGEGEDSVAVVVGNQDCLIGVREEPTASEYYGIPVLNAGHDTDADRAGFQGTADVSTTAGFAVELFVAAPAEASLGEMTADADGAAAFPLSLAEGQNTLRAVCRAPSGSPTEASLATVVFVDTVAPGCTLTPEAGTTIVPSMDLDDEDDNGTQVVLGGHASGGDVAGEAAQFTVGGVNLLTPALDGDGDTQVTASFTTPSPPDTAASFATQDHAGNACQVDRSYAYQTSGCAITITDPGGPITGDANATPGDGLQYDLEVTVDTACAGQTVTTDCSVGGVVSATVPAGGELTLRVTLCADAVCEVSRVCAAEVTNDVGVVTSDGVTLDVDTQAPPIALVLVAPGGLQCGQQYDASIDADAAAGVQIRVAADDDGLADERWIEHTPPGGSPEVVAVDGAGEALITLGVGQNALQAVAEDALDNQARAPAGGCTIDLVDIGVNFDPNIADGLVTPQDSGVTVVGQSALLDLCGTVTVTGVTVTVSIDGGAAQPATVAGMAWCRTNVTLSNGDHTVAVVATDGLAMGANQLDPLTVDVVGPGDPGGLVVTTIDREAAQLSWTAPQDGGPGSPAAAYIVKLSTTAFTAGNFDGNGAELSAPAPSTPGAIDSVVVTQLRAGTDYFFALVAVDAVGNRSAVVATGPHRVDFTGTGRIDPTLVSSDRGWDGFGLQVAGGDFDDDGVDDLAVGAPYTDTSSSSNTFADGVVYVYLGATDGSGIDGAAPTFIIQADPLEETGRFGFALTVLDWDGDGVDDLAVGAPFQGGSSGRVSIFLGGSLFDPGAAPLPAVLIQDTDAAVHIGTDGAGAFFDKGRCGYSLAGGRFDADAQDDLALGCFAADGGRGGALVVHGGAAAPAIVVLSDSDTSQMGALAIDRIRFAGEPASSNFGRHVTALPPLGGAGDPTSELGISALQPAGPNAVYVFRGRAAQPPAGITDLAFAPATDLRLADGGGASNSRFGDAMGTVPDVDGDGHRELVVSDYNAAGGGYLALVDGTLAGDVSLPAGQIARITGGGGIISLGNAIAGGEGDVDDDGIPDLVATGRTGGDQHGQLYIWYGGDLPASGTVTAASTADHTIAAPSSAFNSLPTAEWIGDVDGDGLADLCYGDPDNQGGKVEVLHR
jgi:hypothetical protein